MAPAGFFFRFLKEEPQKSGACAGVSTLNSPLEVQDLFPSASFLDGKVRLDLELLPVTAPHPVIIHMLLQDERQLLFPS